MIQFNSKIFHDTMISFKYGRKGSPWEFNLRDVFRWCELMKAHKNSNPGQFVDLIYLQRMRTFSDREEIKKVYQEIFGETLFINLNPYYHITPTFIQVFFLIHLNNNIIF